jgi:DNA-binding protein H-NS
MNAVIDQIDLSTHSVEELKTLVARAKREIVLKKRNRLQEVRNQMEQLASGLNMSIDEFVHHESPGRKTGGREVRGIRFRNPADPTQTWVGRGKRPRWLREALARGARLDDFAVDR